MIPCFLRPKRTHVFFIVFSLLLSILTFVPGTVRAQSDTLEHTLLWRIEGNGLTKSSYLYGTFHTEDARMFNFRDSVLPALLSSDIAAFELDPNAMSVEVVRRTYNPDSVIDLLDYLNDEEFEILDERIREQTGLPGETFRHTDPSFLLLLVDQPEEVNYDGFEDHSSDEEDGEEEEKDSAEEKFVFELPKETFLDAWLFRTAQLEGKRALGLETIDEQIAITDTIPLRERVHMLVETITVDGYKRLETSREMIKAYLREDLNELLQIVDDEQTNPGVLFKLITERNRNMADRMETLMHEGGTFTAVGAAHLPGDDGVIALLRRKGYTVTPVLSERTGSARRYKRPLRDLPWYPLVDTEEGFRAETPLPTVDIPARFLESGLSSYQPEGRLPKTRRRYTNDITTGLSFFIIENEITLNSLLSADPFASAATTWFGKDDDESHGMTSFLYSGEGKLMRTKEIEVDGIPGKEYTGVDTDGDLTRMRVFQRGGRIYTFLVSGGTSVIKSKDDSRFLKSIRFDSLPKAAWNPHDIVPLSTRVSLPSEPSLDTAKRWNTGMATFSRTISMTSVDPVTGIYYVVEWGIPSPSMMPTSDSLLMDDMVRASIPLDSIRSESSTSIEHGTGERAAREYQAALASGASVTRRIYLTGAMVWSLTVARPAGASDPEGERRFFNNAKLPPQPKAAATAQRYPEQNFSLSLRAPIIDSSEYYYYTGGRTFTAGEWVGNRAYRALVTSYSPYYESQSEEAFFNDQRQFTLDAGDSIIAERQVEAGGLKWREYTVLVSDTEKRGLKYRERLALHGARLYSLRWFSLDPKDNPNDADPFFQSFHLLNSEPTGNIFSRKVDKLMSDLTSADSAVRTSARSSLWSYTFRQEDIPKLYKALEHPSPEAEENSDVIRDRYIAAFRNIHDEHTIDKLTKLYNELPSEHSSRSTILDVLATMRSDESLKAFHDLLINDPPTEGYSYSVFSTFYDSIGGIKVLYPDIIQLTELSSFRSTIFSLTNTALDSGEITVEDIRPQIDMLRESCRGVIVSYREHPYSESSSYYDDDDSENQIYPWEAEQAISLLGRLPEDKETDNLLKRALREENLTVKRASAVALLRHGEEVRAKWLTEIAENPVERLNLYRDLANAGMSERFPEEYRSQMLFAESLISESIYMNEESAPEEIEYVADRQIEWNGQNMRGYLFKYRYHTYGDDSEWGPWYVAFAVQPEAPDQISTESSQVRLNWSEFDPDAIDAQFNELMTMPQEEYEYGD